MIKVTALGVSREIAYILRWLICCIPGSKQYENDTNVILPEDIISGKAPPYGWEPRFPEENKTWFPQLDKEIFFDVFHLNGFDNAEYLKKDGVSIIKWNN